MRARTNNNSIMFSFWQQFHAIILINRLKINSHFGMSVKEGNFRVLTFIKCLLGFAYFYNGYRPLNHITLLVFKLHSCRKLQCRTIVINFQTNEEEGNIETTWICCLMSINLDVPPAIKPIRRIVDHAMFNRNWIDKEKCKFNLKIHTFFSRPLLSLSLLSFSII